MTAVFYSIVLATVCPELEYLVSSGRVLVSLPPVVGDLAWLDPILVLHVKTDTRTTNA